MSLLVNSSPRRHFLRRSLDSPFIRERSDETQGNEPNLTGSIDTRGAMNDRNLLFLFDK